MFLDELALLLPEPPSLDEPVELVLLLFELQVAADRLGLRLVDGLRRVGAEDIGGEGKGTPYFIRTLVLIFNHARLNLNKFISKNHPSVKIENYLDKGIYRYIDKMIY